MTLSLKVYVACVVTLYIKFLVTTGVQAIKTFDAGGRPPEDKNLPLARGRRPQTYGLVKDDGDEKLQRAREVEHRWRRIVMNDLESLPLGLLVFGAGVLASANATVHVPAMVAFTLLRIGHTLAYANSVQPHRAWCWRLSIVAILTGAINALVGAYNMD
ncbi:hypothetical protein ATCC90586_000145 [Pythium insidiosum]|nr:hypothetical protein ATCC90586_000145 [Pythium insidiosum]